VSAADPTDRTPDRTPERPPAAPDARPDVRDLRNGAAALGGALGGVLGGAFGGARRVAGALRDAIDGDGPHHVVGYRGYGTGRTALVQARALRQRTFSPAEASHSRWRNLLDSLRRLNSEPLPNARVQVQMAGTTHALQADAEGFVHRWITLPEALAPGAWHPVRFGLQDGPTTSAADVRGTAGVLVPPSTARFGIVSDMDDTVLQSEVSSFLSAARMVLLENARTRLPFPGVAAFYRALQGAAPGGAGAVGNPIFYVSSSPWNLYDVIADFLAAQEIPLGPILLRDWDLGPSLMGHRSHKLARIREVFATYPTLPFLLVGDSTQEDPEIYGALAREYPGRVLAIYIRDVGRNAARRASIETLAADVRAAGATLVLAEDTLAAARHAALHGWIGAAAVDEVAAASAESAAHATAERRGTAPATPGVSPEPAESPAAPTLVVDDAVRPRDLD
jgi:phosphatidate phosphatase APP1